MDNINIDVAKLTPAQVLKSYRGRRGCMCGCKGKYFATPERREAAGHYRGYPLDDSEVSAGEVLKTLGAIVAAYERWPSRVELLECGTTKTGWRVVCVSYEDTDRIYAVYVIA